MNAADYRPLDLAPLFRRISRQTGLSLPASRAEDLTTGIARVMQQHEVEDMEQLVERLQEPRLFEAVITKLTVGETYFFRDPAQFEAVRNIVLPSLMENRLATSPVMVWSAGCSTGEEPYSVAILMDEEGLGDRVRVVATDICAASLRKARKAEYSEWSFRDDSTNLAGRYFLRNGGRFRLDRRIREAVRFQSLNLGSDPFPRCDDGAAGFDLILCRNVLMYFERSAVKRIARGLFDCLDEGGWLLTGPSDPPLWELAPFETVTTPAGVLYRRRPQGANPGAADETPNLRQSENTSQGVWKAGEGHGVQSPNAPAGSVEECAARIRSLADAGRISAAQEAAAEAVEQHPLAPELHYLQSIALAAADRSDEAIAALRRTIYLDRTLAAAHFLLGRLTESRDPDAALRAFRNVAVLCGQRSPEEAVPLTGGDSAGRLAELATQHIARLRRQLAGAS